MLKKIGVILLDIILIAPIVLIYFDIIMPIQLLMKKHKDYEKILAIVVGVYTLVMLAFIPFKPVVTLIMLILEYLIVVISLVWSEVTKKPETGLGKSAPQGSRTGAGGIFAGLDSIAAKKLFRSLVKKYHPDTGHGDDEAMKKIVRDYKAYQGK